MAASWGRNIGELPGESDGGFIPDPVSVNRVHEMTDG